ncbi:RNA polymerase sigma factor [Bacillus phage BC01]|nr:putative RNA polymerase sigma 28 subunit SigF [Bacillus phage PBC6]AXU41211.1 RNA polymerase sigma factor [Bacillus phage BC01]
MGRKGIGKIKKAKAFKLTQEEIKELIAAAQNGSEEAEEKLIFGNERLVWKVATKYKNKVEYPQDDIYQIGVIGLMKAIRRFDLTYDVKFSTYAIPMIQGEITRFLRDDYIVKISRITRDMAFRILRNEIEQEKPEVIVETLELVTEELPFERALKRVKEALDFIFNHSIKSTDDILHNGGGGSEDITFGEVISGDVNGDWGALVELKDAFHVLDEREMSIIRMRYYHDLTQSEVAKKLSLSQVQVSRLEKRILATLKDELTKEEDTMARPGDRKRAAKLLRDTDMELKDIHEVTLVPMDKLEVLEKKFRATEKEVKTVAPAQPVAKPEPVVKEEPIKEEKVIEVTEKKKAPKRITKEQRAQVIELLKKGVYTVPEIEEKTGVPYANVWYYANKLRIDIVKTTAGMEIVAGMDKAKKERQAANAMIQGGNVGITGKAPTQPSPEMIKRIANAEQKITDADILMTAVPGRDVPSEYVTVGQGISPLRVNASRADVQKLTETFNQMRHEYVGAPIVAAPAQSSFSMTVDLTATGNALPKGEVIGKLEQLIRVVQELPTEQVNFNMKVNS